MDTKGEFNLSAEQNQTCLQNSELTKSLCATSTIPLCATDTNHSNRHQCTVIGAECDC